MNNYLLKNPAIFWLLLPAIISILPVISPIARNFEYEYWLIISLMNALLIPFMALLHGKENIKTKPSILILYGILCAISQFIFSFIHFQLNFTQCLKESSQLWWLVLVVPSVFVGMGFYSITAFIRLKSSRKIAFLSLIALLTTFTLFALGLLWFLPQKRITHILLAHLHGPIYDAYIPIDWGIIYARTIHLLTGITLIYLFNLTTSRLGKKFVVLVIAPILFSAYCYQIEIPSLSHGNAALKKQLSTHIQYPSFTIHYLRESNISERQIKLIEMESHFHVTELRKTFPESMSHVEIYIYPDEYHKKLWFGGNQTDVTDVVTPSIHITWDSFPHPTLRHELVHAISSDHAFHGLGFHPNMAFTEGLAVALAPKNSTQDPEKIISSMKKHDRIPKASNFFSPLFWIYSGLRSYTLAGAFIKHLIEDLGSSKVVELYNGKDWNQIKSEPLDAYFSNWIRTIEQRYENNRYDDLGTESLSRSPGILNDICPHSKALLRRKKSENIIEQLRVPNFWNPSEHYYKWLLDLDPKNPLTKIRLMRQNAKSAFKLKNPKGLDKLLSELADNRNWPPKIIEDLENKILAGDINYLSSEDIGSNIKNYWINEAEEKWIPLGGSLIERKIWARRTLLKNLSNPDEKRAWISYLSGFSQIPEYNTFDADQPWIIDYLYNLKHMGKPAEQLINSQIPDSVRKNLPDSFLFQWHLNLGHRLLVSEKWHLAAETYQQAEAYSQPSQRDFIRLLVRFSSWAAQKETQ